jgi:hypothetical protein
MPLPTLLLALNSRASMLRLRSGRLAGPHVRQCLGGEPAGGVLTAVHAAVQHSQCGMLPASLAQHRCNSTSTGAQASRSRLAHPVVTTAPVPWMSSLKQSSLSRRRCRMVNARSVWKSARARGMHFMRKLHRSATSAWHAAAGCISADCIKALLYGAQTTPPAASVLLQQVHAQALCGLRA